VNDHRRSSGFLPGTVGSEVPTSPFSISVRIDAASLDVERSVDGRVYIVMADMAVQLIVSSRR
jgi:hypothetical protein